MFDKLRIGTSAKTAQKFTPVHPNPDIGDTHGISLMIHGKHSDVYRNSMADILRSLKKGEEPTTDQLIDQSAKVVADCCEGWHGVTDNDNKFKKFDRDELYKMLKDTDFTWLRIQAEQFMREDKNFFQKRKNN